LPVLAAIGLAAVAASGLAAMKDERAHARAPAPAKIAARVADAQAPALVAVPATPIEAAPVETAPLEAAERPLEPRPVRVIKAKGVGEKLAAEAALKPDAKPAMAEKPKVERRRHRRRWCSRSCRAKPQARKEAPGIFDAWR
jgi:hypothetical protein